MICSSATTTALNLLYPIHHQFPTHKRTTIVNYVRNQHSKPRNLSLTSKITTISQTPLLLKQTKMGMQNNHMVYATNLNFLTSIGTGTLSVPVTHLASGVAKWLDLYIKVLSVRLMLAWYPNLPWEKQPFSAIRSLCDPYLYLFRSLIPPSGTLDYSAIIGILVLTKLAELLNTKGMLI